MATPVYIESENAIVNLRPMNIAREISTHGLTVLPVSPHEVHGRGVMYSLVLGTL
jgi:hypothetical protein